MKKRQKWKLLKKYGFIHTRNSYPMTENHERRIDNLLKRDSNDRPDFVVMIGKGAIVEAELLP